MQKKSQNLFSSAGSVRATQKDSQNSFTAMIEIPKGSSNMDYGFILDTLAQDGNPLDVIIIVSETTFPGRIIEVKPIGMLDLSLDKKIDQKILCVPVNDLFLNHINELRQIPSRFLQEIKKTFRTHKWLDREAAVKAVRQAQDLFATSAKHPERNQARQ